MVKKDKPTHKEEIGAKKKQKFRPKPKSTEEFTVTYKKQPNEIKNKQKRVEVHYTRNAVKNQLKMK
jgi:hypothetical protein